MMWTGAVVVESISSIASRPPKENPMSNQGVVSADDHIDLSFLPKDLWTSRAPARLKDNAPRVVETDKGPVWVCGEESWGTWGPRISAISGLIVEPGEQRRKREGEEERHSVFTDGVPRATTVELRLQDMDLDGVESSVMYGPISALSTNDPEMREFVYAAYNEWLVEFCANDPKRLIGVAQTPLEPELAAREMRRAHALGLKTVNILGSQAVPPLYEPDWDPVWQAADDTGMVVAFHVAANEIKTVATKLDAKKAGSLLSRVGGVFQLVPVVAGIVGWGVLDRFPGVKLVMAEAGLGWVPYVIMRMTHRWEQVNATADQWAKTGGLGLKHEPSYYFAKQIWTTFQEDHVGLHMLDFINPDRVMWASDYPHPDSTWPASKVVISDDFAHLDEATKNKIIGGNARALYGL
jgi:predicted TIM-barrel fold metal-dependent hydrolase